VHDASHSQGYATKDTSEKMKGLDLHDLELAREDTRTNVVSTTSAINKIIYMKRSAHIDLWKAMIYIY
jgi:hypothetical protein